MTDTPARDELAAHFTSDTLANELLDAHAAEVERARDEVIIAWLGKKAAEYRATRSKQHALQADAIDTMADKIRRGAARTNNLLGAPEQPPAADLPDGTRLCGHGDYHGAHPWADRPGTWCPGHTDADPELETHAGFDIAGDPATHRGPREKCRDAACEHAQCEDGFVPDAPRAPGLCANCGDSKAWHRPA